MEDVTDALVRLTGGMDIEQRFGWFGGGFENSKEENETI